jgi:hypothetical protein
VEQYQRRAGAFLYIVEAHAIHFDELALRRRFLLSVPRTNDIEDSAARESNGKRCGRYNGALSIALAKRYGRSAPVRLPPRAALYAVSNRC